MPLAPPLRILKKVKFRQSHINFGSQPSLGIEFAQVQSALTRPSPESVPEEAATAAVELDSER